MKLLVIEDHPIVIAGCRALFSQDPDILMREARTLAEAREAIALDEPDVIVADINLPDGSGLDLTRECFEARRKMKVVVFSMSDAPILAFRALECGARGYVSKNGDPAQLRAAVNAVAEGKTWIDPDLVQELAMIRTGTPECPHALSNREVSILRNLVRGRSLSEIADDLGLSYKTVTNDCADMRLKLNARTTAELVRIALELKIA